MLFFIDGFDVDDEVPRGYHGLSVYGKGHSENLTFDYDQLDADAQTATIEEKDGPKFWYLPVALLRLVSRIFEQTMSMILPTRILKNRCYLRIKTNDSFFSTSKPPFAVTN